MPTPNKRRNPIPRLLSVIVLAIALVAAVGAMALAVGARGFASSDRLAPNIRIAEIPVGGLSRAEAISNLQTEWLPQLPPQMGIAHGGKTYSFTREELGARAEIEQAVDQAMRLGREGGLIQQVSDRITLMRTGVAVPVTITVDQDALASRIRDIAAKVNREARNARIQINSAGGVDVVPGATGLKVDQAASAAAVATALQDPTAATAQLVVTETQPKVKSSDLAHLEVVLGRFSTSYNAGKVDRTHNLNLAIDAVNGTVVMPGAEFSANSAIGPRNESRGFREAPIFVNGEITPSTGGGICQIATTIYNAALLAGLTMVERHHHSMPVAYAEAGRDATLYWGSLDLRFRNSTGAPIVLLASSSGSQVHVSIVGKRDARKRVRIVRDNVTQIPFETEEKPEPTLPVGKKKVEEKGRNGIRVTVSRVTVQDDGTEKREVLHTDVYKPYKQVVLAGTKQPATAPATPVPATSGLLGTKPPASPTPANRPTAPKPPAGSKPKGH